MPFLDLDFQDRRDRLVAVLRELVSQSGYSQRKLAEQLGISKSQVGHVLTGQRRLEYVEFVDWITVLEVTESELRVLLDSPVAP